MSAGPLVSAPSCCPTSCDELIENVPGPQGEPGANGTNGTNGENARTTVSTNFVQPAVDATVVVAVASSAWATVGQIIFVQNGGYYELTAKTDATHLTLKNLGYDDNVPPTTVVVSANQVGPGGPQGPEGSVDTGGALLAANNLDDVDNTSTARTNLGLTSAATTALTDFLLKAGNLSGLANAATARTNLGVAIGVNVQAFNALLTVIAALSPIAANQIIYGTGANAVAFTSLTSFARTLIDDATAAAARATLGNILPRYGILGSLTAVDLNVATTDNAIVIESTRYIIDAIIVENASVNLTASTAGVFTSTGGGGTAIANDQALSALTASSKWVELSLQSIAGTDVFTSGTIYFRTGTPQGAPSSANVWILGRTLS